MPVCVYCIEDDETPTGASVIKDGEQCARCGMRYKEQRAQLSNSQPLTEYIDHEERGDE